MRHAFAFGSGLLFGAGLLVSGLANPAKVLAFLDIAGPWDPSLAVTMAAALLVTGIGYRLVMARQAPLYGTFDVPGSAPVDARLVFGAAVFGLGWGLAGFCPGPAIVATALGGSPALVFFAAMLTGMTIARALLRAKSAPGPRS